MSKPDLKIIVLFVICVLLPLGACFASAGEGTEYISIDEIKPDMDAYCLTVLCADKIERFELKVVDVVRNFTPSRSAILVVGTGAKFKDIGFVKGCSGSPVYIDGKLAGALSAGFPYSKDPLYIVTPIDEMHRVVPLSRQPSSVGGAALSIDFTKPLALDAEILTGPANAAESKNYIVTSLSESVCNSLTSHLEPFGLVPVAAASGSSNIETDKSGPPFKPGSSIAVPLVSGDISIAAIGTVTEVLDDKVLAFGHPFLGYGPVDLPMATARVHTVVSNIAASFKLASADSGIAGAIYADGAAGVVGLVGAEPKLLPTTIEVDRSSYPDFSPMCNTKNLYNCKLAVNRLYTPLMTRSVIIGAAMSDGPLPREHTIKYSVKVSLRDPDDPAAIKDITFENISSQRSVGPIALQTASLVAILMNNPYRDIEITSLDCSMQITPKDSITYIETASMSKNKVKAGEAIDVFVELIGHLSRRTQHSLELRIPEGTPPGKYEVIIAGPEGYERFLRKNAAHKFIYKDMPTLLGALDNILKIRADRLYLLGELVPAGITIGQKELADLPKTKAILMKDDKRTTTARPYRSYIEKSIPIETIVFNRKVMKITVEE